MGYATPVVEYWLEQEGIFESRLRGCIMSGR